MVSPTLKATVDGLSQAERRDLRHYLEQTIDETFVLTSEQMEELERRDAQLVSGAVEPVKPRGLMQRARARIQ